MRADRKAGVVVLLALAGCGQRFCGDLGCEDQVAVVATVDAEPMGAVRGTATSAGGDVLVAFDCTAGQSGDGYQCVDDRVILYVSEPTFALHVENGDGSIVYDGDVAPDYQLEQPNGPECDPTCRQAEIEVPLTPA